MTKHEETARQNGRSRTIVWASTGSEPPPMNAQRGRIRVISMIFAPIILPADISLFFFIIDVIAVASSGREVPTATIVTPMISEGTPSISASC